MSVKFAKEIIKEGGVPGVGIPGVGKQAFALDKLSGGLSGQPGYLAVRRSWDYGL